MNIEQLPHQDNKKDEDILHSIKLNKIIIPILIGVFSVIYLVWDRADWKELKNVSWNEHTLFGISFAILCLIIHHLAYSYRLYSLSDREFTFKKCIELIFIWELALLFHPPVLEVLLLLFICLLKKNYHLQKQRPLFYIPLCWMVYFSFFLFPFYFSFFVELSLDPI